MPYISREKREVLDSTINALHKLLVDLEMDDESNNLEGNLNYVITKLLRVCYGSNSYGEINDAMGMMFCAALEHYRTVAAPYEDEKKQFNGDVSGHMDNVVLDYVTVTAGMDESDGG